MRKTKRSNKRNIHDVFRLLALLSKKYTKYMEISLNGVVIKYDKWYLKTICHDNLYGGEDKVLEYIEFHRDRRVIAKFQINELLQYTIGYDDKGFITLIKGEVLTDI